ncbi:uncharacterized protein LOC143033822 [Oratosquilla oratoria]|uniref:uncharacterized protein LOC143033822 n=1 Tax=Oratosquilla oratoria TaxID=337810 RepID=UPI003F766960
MPKLSKQKIHLQKIRTSTLATQGEKERTPALTLLSPPPPPPLVLPPAALSLPSTSTSSAPDPLHLYQTRCLYANNCLLTSGYKDASLLQHLGFRVSNPTVMSLMQQEPVPTPERKPKKRKS